MRNTIRLMTAVAPELNERLDALCKAYGMSKSGLIAYYVGRAVDNETRANGLLTGDTMVNMMKALADSGTIPQFELPNGETYKPIQDRKPKK